MSGNFEDLKEILTHRENSSEEKITKLITDTNHKKQLMALLNEKLDTKGQTCHLTVKISTLESSNEETVKIAADDISDILESMGEVKEIKDLGGNIFEITFSNSMQAQLAKLGFEDLVLKELNLKFEVLPIKRKASLPVVHSPKRWDEETTNEIKERIETENKKQNKQGIVNFYTFTNNTSKFTCRYDVMIENDKNFQIAKKIIGAKGCNMKKIIDMAMGEMTYNNDHSSKDLLKLRLRGRGSGFREGPDNRESDEPLHLCVSAKNYNAYKTACFHVEELLEKIFEEFVGHMSKVNGKSGASLDAYKFRKNESISLNNAQ